MKKIKLLTAGLLATAVASMASASTIIRVAGSTAFRGASEAAICNDLTSPTAAYVGSSLSKASRAIFHGTIKNGPSAGQDVYIVCGWSGSEGGLIAVSNQTNVLDGSAPTGTQFTWLDTTNTMSAVSFSEISGTFTGGTSLSSPVYAAANTCDIAMSDSYPSSGIGVFSPDINTGVLTDDDNGTGTGVGVVDFTWAKGPYNASSGIPSGSYAALSNMTAIGAQNLLANGIVPLSMLTGISGDEAYDVVLAGRDADSGTRVNTLAETAFGVDNQVTQYTATVSGSTITGIAKSAPLTTPNFQSNQASGNGGYGSGGTLAGVLSDTVTSTTYSGKHRSSHPGENRPFVMVSYLGIPDSQTITGGATISYAGIPFSVAAIQEGQYSFWGYEHVVYNNNVHASEDIVTDFADQMANQIQGTDATWSGVLLSTMTAAKAVEGGIIATSLY